MYTNILRRRLVGTGGSFSPDTWEGIQSIVRAGKARDYFEIGHKFPDYYPVRDKDFNWEVIGFNHDIPTDKRYTNSMTLFADIWVALGTFAPMDDTSGYIGSRVRAYLNDESEDGFLGNLNPEVAAVIGLVDKQVGAATSDRVETQDLFSDKVFLISPTEMNATSSELRSTGILTGEKVYEFFEELEGTKRWPSYDSRGHIVWLRGLSNPNALSSARIFRISNGKGRFGSALVHYLHYIVPAIVIY